VVKYIFNCIDPAKSLSEIPPGEGAGPATDVQVRPLSVGRMPSRGAAHDFSDRLYRADERGVREQSMGDGGRVLMPATFADRNANPARELEPTVMAKASGYNAAKSEGSVSFFSGSDSRKIIARRLRDGLVPVHGVFTP